MIKMNDLIVILIMFLIHLYILHIMTLNAWKKLIEVSFFFFRVRFILTALFWVKTLDVVSISLLLSSYKVNLSETDG